MATENEFNLEQSIHDWKVDLSSKGNITNEEVEELGNHLTDTIDSLNLEELSIEERFVIARHRIGNPNLLNRAFGTGRSINFEKISWLAQGVLYFLLIRFFALTFLGLSGWIFESLKSDSQLIYLSVSLVCQTLAFLSVYLIYRRTVKIRKRTASTIRINFLLLLWVLAIYGFNLIGLNFFGPIQIYSFALITQVFYYFFVGMIFIVFIYLNIKEWRKYRVANS